MKASSALAVFCALVALMTNAGFGADLRTDGALYVSDSVLSTVSQFALVKNVPIGTPAGTLHTSYVPGAIAVDANETLYVADPAALAVDAYAPGAKGHARPERVLSLSRKPVSLALDGQGYLYVGETQAKVEIFSPTASGKAHPVSVITLVFASNATSAVHVDAGGRLFAAQNTSGGSYVAQYADPRTGPVIQRQLDGISGGSPFLGIDGLGTDLSGELYVSQSAWPEVWAFSESACCGYPADRLIVATGGNSGTIAPVGLAVRGRHAFFLSGRPYPPVIYVYDVLQATQTPLETISGPFLKNPIAVAVTP